MRHYEKNSKKLTNKKWKALENASTHKVDSMNCTWIDWQIENRKQTLKNSKEAYSNLNIGSKTSELIHFWWGQMKID